MLGLLNYLTCYHHFLFHYAGNLLLSQQAAIPPSCYFKMMYKSAVLIYSDMSLIAKVPLVIFVWTS